MNETENFRDSRHGISRCPVSLQILDQTKFKDIIKIKTIGSTYMAASGITESAECEDAPRWGHLSTLVEFALELKKALSSINEQSFNHFVLKMGINHGPVTAGVIGARKPHYDIWGNTVNVASRMESTGKVGCIQVKRLMNIHRALSLSFSRTVHRRIVKRTEITRCYVSSRYYEHFYYPLNSYK